MANRDLIYYTGRRLYQCNEDDFSIKVLSSIKLFPNHNFGSFFIEVNVMDFL